jgi:hypothetical protein
LLVRWQRFKAAGIAFPGSDRTTSNLIAEANIHAGVFLREIRHSIPR